MLRRTLYAGTVSVGLVAILAASAWGSAGHGGNLPAAPSPSTAQQAALSASTSSPSSARLRVASSLDGKTVLPHRIRWLALPTLPPSQIAKVEFLIDGRLAWVERKSPYTYADDRGYLVTSFLAPGEHRFAVRAIPNNGTPATDTVIARVLPPPRVPRALAGTWERDIKDTSGAPAPGGRGNPTSTLTPPGTYRITFEPRWIHDVFPCTGSPCTFNQSTGAGGEFVSDWTPGSTTFHVGGAVTFRVPNDNDRLAGWWCETWGPSATYTWSVTGTTLTLAPVGGQDACRVRGFIWAGQWTRVA